jgi:hypothetical protein
MIDPGMGAAPMPPEAAMPAPQRPIDIVIAALGAMQMERQGENDAVLSAVLKATGAGMAAGPEAVTEGAAFGVPGGPEMGAY